MLPHLNVNDHRYVPSLDQLRKQARFLRDHCNVQLNHAYEMVAYLYRFSSWGELLNHTTSDIAIKDLQIVAHMREELQTYRNCLPQSDLKRLSQLAALKGTITEAVVSDRIKTLNDLDIVQIYNCLYNEEYWGEPAPVSWYEVLDETDRCLVLLAKRTALAGRTKTVNPHISFPWFGFRMYGYLHSGWKHTELQMQRTGQLPMALRKKIHHGILQAVVCSVCQRFHPYAASFTMQFWFLRENFI
ncbi:Uncharacterised protein [Mycobacterium tuberculosis]|uniref:hypothetical protein n=1 Tax=Morganella morganii TaxID=582 RepID=UPI00091A57C1|nr:hypothetical protein [Morganella morganii]SGC98259.1 Uncharacterised protein [Mycobacterium tuberculosis]